ncbi:unnamed protein product [Adineta ricciae]|uniref:Uncharacterized protein n=1 Tax=Adineta ricciae TaxID=249248 RepID=A0A815CD65_ADIRI|nr:unnamed protein product [Adineta ricciae]
MFPSATTTIMSVICLLMITFITANYAYVIDTGDLRNSLLEQHFDYDLPIADDRFVRATKFPRIGRSLTDFDDITSFNSGDVDDIHNDEDYRWFEQRSVLFPRIGKRAFHNIMWTNSYSNPHRMLDSQGRYHNNGYDYHIHPNHYQSASQFRGKRNLPM